MSSPTPDPDATVDLPDSLASRREQMFPRLTDADIARIRRFLSRFGTTPTAPSF